MEELCLAGQHYQGRIRVGHVVPQEKRSLWLPRSPWSPNSLLRPWASTVAKLLATGDSSYRVTGMYLEFTNDNGQFENPTFTVDEGVEYYEGLTGTQDYLRVPLTAALTDSTDEVHYPDGNRNNYFAITAGDTGINGLDFDSDSLLMGGALVVFRHPTDFSQDLVIARAYIDANQRIAKPSVGQLGLEWEQLYFVNNP